MDSQRAASSVPDLSPDDLPAWMRLPRRRVDWGMALALLLGLLSAWSFILRPGLPHGTALELHVYRAAEMADVIHDGVLYPRWAPNLLYGYGLPLFNYVAPAPAYLATLYQVATEGRIVDGVRLVLIVGALAGAAGTFAFVRWRWGPLAGLVAVGTYTLSPSLLFLLPHVYGDLPLWLALQLLPGVFWAVDRARRYGQGKDAWLLAGTVGLLLLTDERAAPWLLGMVVGWLIWLGLFDRGALMPGGDLLAWSAGALGVGLAAFFWLPLLVESGQAHWLALESLDVAPLTLGELLVPSAAPDLGAFNPSAPRNVGLAAWALALGAAIGVGVRGWRRARRAEPILEREDRWGLYFLLLTGVLFILLAAGLAAGLESYYVPGLLALPLAVLAGRATVWLRVLRAGWPGSVGTALLACLPLVSALPALYPPPWPEDFGATDIVARLAMELDDYGLGLVPPGERVPLPMANVPAPSRSLVESYYSGTVDRVNRAALVGAQVDLIEHRTTLEHLLVRAANPVRVPLFISAFPGWQVTTREEGDPATLVADEAGLLALALPAGTHDVTVFLGSTPTRTLAWAVSLAALLLLAGVSSRRPRPQDDDMETPGAVPLLSRHEAVLIGTVLGVFLLALPLLIGGPGLFWRQSPQGQVLEARVQLRRFTQGGLDLIAYSLSDTTLRPGDSLELTLYWRAVRPMPENYQVAVSLTEAGGGQRVTQSYKRHVGGYPTTRWPLGRYVRDVHRLPLPETLPGGSYLLVVELWQCQASALGVCGPDERLAFFDERGAALGQSLVLPVVITVAP